MLLGIKPIINSNGSGSHCQLDLSLSNVLSHTLGIAKDGQGSGQVQALQLDKALDDAKHQRNERVALFSRIAGKELSFPVLAILLGVPH